MNWSKPRAMTIIEHHRDIIELAPHLPPQGELADAYRTFKQPIRAHLQSLIGLGKALPLMGDESLEHWNVRVGQAAYIDRYATIKQAVTSNIWVDLSGGFTDVFAQEATEALESASARLISIKKTVLARRVHIVTNDNNSDLIFLRVIEFGPTGLLELQSNFTGPCIDREPVGRLARAMLDSCGWKISAGWWIVQPGGIRAANDLRPIAVALPKPEVEIPQPDSLPPQPR